jgi:DNA-binding NarL/FixJ family response regulator
MVSERKYNLLIVEDHELTRFGLKTTFAEVSFIGTIYEAPSAEVAYGIVKNNHIDLVIMDLGLPEVDGITAIKCIKDLKPEIKFVVLTSHKDKNDVLNSLKSGANAYCSKEIKLPRLIEVLNSVIDGASWFDPAISNIILGAVNSSGDDEVLSVNNYNLTAREKQILKLITEGYSNVEIAKTLFVSVNTTKVHVASILQKLEVDDRLQAAIKALKEHIV